MLSDVTKKGVNGVYAFFIFTSFGILPLMFLYIPLYVGHHDLVRFLRLNVMGVEFFVASKKFVIY